MSTPPTLDEFAAIASFFAPLADPPVALNLRDDAAVFTPPPGETLVFTKDAMVEGVHFLPHDPPGLVARKLLRVNLSDLAAMGARPLGYLLAVAVRKSDAAQWIADFAAGLAEDQKIFSCKLWGGDTVTTPGPVTLSLTAIGAVGEGRALQRAGAQAGDLIAMTGSLGDGALGFAVATGQCPGLQAEAAEYLVGRYRLPTPRLDVGARLLGVARAAMDISDGLLGDLAHICAASGVGAVLQRPDLPLSEAARAALAANPDLENRVFSGDDYELLFTLPPAKRADLVAISADTGVPITIIGHVTAESGVRLVDGEGRTVDMPPKGYTHF